VKTLRGRPGRAAYPLHWFLGCRSQIVNATVISLNDAPKGYKDFDSGVAKKFVLEPHGVFLA